jgi:YfiH family protein
MSSLATRLPAPFVETDGAIAASLPGGEVRFTTRRGPDLREWQEPRTVAAVAALAGTPPGRVAQGPQEHGARVRVVARVTDLEGEAPAADAQATALAGVACLVRVADCVPIVLVAPEAVAAVHAGWRGLAAGVVEAAVGALRTLGAGELRAAIGPCARVCCYETGPEVHAAFAHHGPAVRRGDHADLVAVAAAVLAGAGVGELHDTGLCTICEPGLLWSHRRDGPAAGRQGGIAWRS